VARLPTAQCSRQDVVLDQWTTWLRGGATPGKLRQEITQVLQTRSAIPNQIAFDGFSNRLKRERPSSGRQVPTSLRERRSDRPNHAGELRQPATGSVGDAKVTAKW
jgi:hypothetical protein